MTSGAGMTYSRRRQTALLIAAILAILLSGCASDKGTSSQSDQPIPPSSHSNESAPQEGDAEADAELALRSPAPLAIEGGRVLAPGGQSSSVQARAMMASLNQTGQPTQPGPPNVQSIVDAWHASYEITSGSGVALAVAMPPPSGSGPAQISTYVAGNLGASTSGSAPNPVTASTLFEIGSETKTFTGGLLAQLVSSGKVSLDDPLSKFAPPGINVPAWSAGGTTTPITIGNLATHQSGLPRIPKNLANDPAAKQNYSETMMWQAISETALLWQPGTSWLYSNFGFGVLGTVLANISQPGQAAPPYAQAVSQVLTGPSGMSSTRIEDCGTTTCPQLPGLATPYLAGNKPAPFWNNSGALAGAGGLVSDISDMGSWVAATLGYPSPISGFGSIPTQPISDVKTICTAPNQCKPASGFQMGMSWQLYQGAQWLKEPFVFKNGGTAGMHSATFMVPGRRLAVTVLSNSPNPAQVSELGQHVVAALVAGQ